MPWDDEEKKEKIEEDDFMGALDSSTPVKIPKTKEPTTITVTGEDIHDVDREGLKKEDLPPRSKRCMGIGDSDTSIHGSQDKAGASPAEGKHNKSEDGN